MDQVPKSFKGKRKIGGGIARRRKKKRKGAKEQVAMASAEKEQAAVGSPIEMAMASASVQKEQVAIGSSPIEVMRATALFGSPLSPSSIIGAKMKIHHYRRKPWARCLQRSLLPSWRA
jgi:hypothetical protein